MTPVPAPATESVPAVKTAPTAQEKPAAQETVPAAPAVKPAPTPAAAAPAKVEAVPATAANPAPAAAPAVLSEADAMALAKKSGCLVCHAVDKKVVGPAWKDVAAKYRGDAGAEARMMEKIAKGGKGVWGSTVMPPNPKLSEADRQALARFVLSLK
jgi:cytochrome c